MMLPYQDLKQVAGAMYDFGDPARPVMMHRLENGAVVANSAQVHPTAVLHPYACVGPAASVGVFAEIGEGAFVGPACRIPSGATIGARGVIGYKNEGYLHCMVPGGPYTLDAHYDVDGVLQMSVGCVTRPLDVWAASWAEIAEKHRYGHPDIVVAFFAAARLLARPQSGAHEIR